MREYILTTKDGIFSILLTFCGDGGGISLANTVKRNKWKIIAKQVAKTRVNNSY